MRLAVILSCCCCSLAFGGPGTGPTEYSICLPARNTAETRLAVAELTNHVQRVIPAARLVAVGRGRLPDGPQGQFSFIFAPPPGAAPVKPFESHYRIEGNTCWFWGDDGGEATAFDWGDNRGSESRTRNGSLFAVELFAERELGITWVWPGEDGVLWTPRRALKFAAQKEESFETALTFSKLRNYGGSDYCKNSESFRAACAFTPEVLREGATNFLAQAHAERALWSKRQRLQNRAFVQYGHAFTDWKKRFFKTRPELFNYRAAQKDRGFTGTQGDDRTKRCVANEGNVDLIVSEWCRKGTNAFLNVCENDSAFYCECAGCRALDAVPDSMTDRYVNFWNRIARKARAIRPDVKLVTYAYSHYRMPPVREKIECPENMLIGFVPSLLDDFEAACKGWQAAGMKHFFLRPNFHHYSGTIPRGMERVLYGVFKRCLELGMIGVDYDCGTRRQVLDFEYYVTVRQMADPTRPFDELCAEYYRAYGAAAGDVRRYFEAVRAAGEAARNDYMAHAAAQKDFLDDSQLSILQCYGRTERELSDEAAILDRAYLAWRGKLPAAEFRRLEELTMRARQAVRTFRFLTASRGDAAAFERAAQDLTEFRVANRAHFSECWPLIFGNWYGELRTWRKMPRYLIETMDGGTLDPRGEPYGWSASFEGACYSKWRREGRDNYAFTTEAAARGKTSLKLFADRDGATENDNVHVIPGRRYRMTAQVRGVGAVKGVRLRVWRYATAKTPGGELVNTRFAELPGDRWLPVAVEFTAPLEFPAERAKWGPNMVECVRATIRAEKAAAGAAVLVDDIAFELIGK